MKRTVLLVLLTMFSGCESPFAPRTLVERLRLLGIRAEPPEISPLGSTELGVLVADPAGGGRPLTCSWAVCLIDLGYSAAEIDCPGPGSYLLEGDCEGAHLDLPELAGWLAENGFDPEMLPEEIPEGADIDEVPLFVGVEVFAGDDYVRGIKRIGVNMTGEEFNSNPVLTGLRANGVDLGDSGLRADMGSRIELEPVIDEASREMYQRQGEEEDRLEDFLFSWFSTSGEFKDRRTILDVDPDGQRLDINEWDVSGDYALPGPGDLWLVVRDGRYGTDWLTLPIEVLEPD